MLFEQIELFLLGTATVVDTVLLLMIWERVNRSQVAVWLHVLLGGLWLVHAASLAHELVHRATLVPGLAQACWMFISLGLLLMPSGLLHAALRLNVKHFMPAWFYAALYLPLLALPWLLARSALVPADAFMELVSPVAFFYLSWVVIVNCLSIVLFLRVPASWPDRRTVNFYPRLAFLLALMTLATVSYYLISAQPALEPIGRLVLILAPLLPALLFVWYTIKRNLLPLVMERTLLYGAMIVTLLLLHRLLVTPLAEEVGERAKLDLLLLEGWLLLAIIAVWPPLRSRFREAARYLLSSNVHQVRDATRRLSVELSQRASAKVPELLHWMAQALQTALEVESATIWLRGANPAQHTFTHSSSRNENSLQPIASEEAHADCIRVYAGLEKRQASWFERGTSAEAELEESLYRLKGMWVFRFEYLSVCGLVVLGPRLRADRLAQEQLASLALLCEQLAATLRNRQLEVLRWRAERLSMQQEKLSALGLIAGSLAHELKNPLSSIRTIAALMLEDLGTDSPHGHDLSIIIAEIDRLRQTTQGLLEYSRPATDSAAAISPDMVIARLLHILQQLARQKHVQVCTSLGCADQKVAASDAALSEIFFNLIKNAIEAVGTTVDSSAAAGRVDVISRCEPGKVRVTIRDNGPGMSADVQASLYEPFVTDKSDGTGLGLYVVAERIRELSGTIKCWCPPAAGTQFDVWLPCVTSTAPCAVSVD